MTLHVHGCGSASPCTFLYVVACWCGPLCILQVACPFVFCCELATVLYVLFVHIAAIPMCVSLCSTCCPYLHIPGARPSTFPFHVPCLYSCMSSCVSVWSQSLVFPWLCAFLVFPALLLLALVRLMLLFFTL